MTTSKVGKKKYWYRNYRIHKTTDQKLESIKKKIGKTWDGVFREMAEAWEKANKLTNKSVITTQAYSYLMNYIIKNKVPKEIQKAVAQEIASEETVDLEFLKKLLKAKIIKI